MASKPLQLAERHDPELAGARGVDDDAVAGEEHLRLIRRQGDAVARASTWPGRRSSTVASAWSTSSTVVARLHDLELVCAGAATTVLSSSTSVFARPITC